MSDRLAEIIGDMMEHGLKGAEIVAVSEVFLDAERRGGSPGYRLSEALEKVWAIKPPEGLWQSLFLRLAKVCDEQREKAIEVPARAYTPRAYRIGQTPTPRLPPNQWHPLTMQVYARDGYVCAYCGDLNGPFCIDHIHPLGRGGTHDVSNLAVACIPCNSSKCDLLPSEWKGRYVL